MFCFLQKNTRPGIFHSVIHIFILFLQHIQVNITLFIMNHKEQETDLIRLAKLVHKQSISKGDT